MAVGVEISKRLVLINSASSVATRLLNVSVLIWLHQYLLRRISPEEYSIYVVVVSVMVFVPLLTTVLTSGLNRYIVEAYAKGDERRVTQIVSTMFPPVLAAGLVILTGGCVLAWYVDRVLTIAPEHLWDARIMLAMLMFLAALTVATAPVICGLYVRQKFVWLNLINVGADLLRIGLLFVLLFGFSTRVLWVVVATVCANVCRLLVTQGISRRLVPALQFRRSEIQWGHMRELTSYGVWVFVGQMADLMRTGVNPLILNKLATAMDVTCFHLGSIVQMQIQGLAILTSAPLQPVLTAMYATGSKERLRNAYLRGGRYALWAALMIAIPLMIYRREVIMLYVGEQYLPAATVMGLLLLMFPVAYGNVMLWKLAQAQAQIGCVTRRMVFIQLTTLVLTLYFVGVLKMGAIGSAVAMAIVSVVGQPLLLWPLGVRLAEASFSMWWRETMLPGMIPAIAAGVAWMVLKMAVRPDSWLVLGACVACGMVAYCVVLALFCIKPYERQILRSAMARLRL